MDAGEATPTASAVMCSQIKGKMPAYGRTSKAPPEKRRRKTSLKSATRKSIRRGSVLRRSVAVLGERRIQPSYEVPKEAWIEVWTDLRRKQNVFDQGWEFGATSIKPRHEATVFGSVLYSTRSEMSSSTGFYPTKRTRCIGDGDEDAFSRVPPEWQSAPLPKGKMQRAIQEERWIKEMIIERKLKGLCRRHSIDEVFGHYDVDGSGALDLDEFQTMLASIGDDLNKRELSWLVRELSKGQQYISLDDFKRFVTRSNRVGVSCTVEWPRVFPEELYATLRNLYDPRRRVPQFHPLYTLEALARRDSLKFDPRVRRTLNALWKKIDLDKSGRIELNEYILMHEKICHVMASLGKLGAKVAPGGQLDLTAQRQLALEDWAIDNQGFGFVDYTRFVSCWFQIADQFTDSITADEYDNFLRSIIGNLFHKPRLTAAPECHNVDTTPAAAAASPGMSSSPDAAPSVGAAPSSSQREVVAARNPTTRAFKRLAAVADIAVLIAHTASMAAMTASTKSTASVTKLSQDLKSRLAAFEQERAEQREREARRFQKELDAAVEAAAEAAAEAATAAAEATASALRDVAGAAQRLATEQEAAREEARRRDELERRRATAATVIQRLARSGIRRRRARQKLLAMGVVVEEEDEFDEGLEAVHGSTSSDTGLVEGRPLSAGAQQLWQAEAVAEAPAPFQDALESSATALRFITERAAGSRVHRAVFQHLVVRLRERTKLTAARTSRRTQRASKFQGGGWSDDEADAAVDPRERAGSFTVARLLKTSISMNAFLASSPNVAVVDNSVTVVNKSVSPNVAVVDKSIPCCLPEAIVPCAEAPVLPHKSIFRDGSAGDTRAASPAARPGLRRRMPCVFCNALVVCVCGFKKPRRQLPLLEETRDDTAALLAEVRAALAWHEDVGRRHSASELDLRHSASLPALVHQGPHHKEGARQMVPPLRPR